VLLGLVKVRHKPLPPALRFFEKHRNSVTDGLHLISSGPRIAALAATSAVVWAADMLPIWLICKSLGVGLTLFPLLLVMGMSCLAALVPAAPANIGTLQYALVLAFQLLGQDGNIGFGLALLMQGSLIAGSAAVGAGLYLITGLAAARIPAGSPHRGSLSGVPSYPRGALGPKRRNREITHALQLMPAEGDRVEDQPAGQRQEGEQHGSGA
jgi:uncharacterized membrane protein YbhN (UPF0104 family)